MVLLQLYSSRIGCRTWRSTVDNRKINRYCSLDFTAYILSALSEIYLDLNVMYLVNFDEAT
jgi:hypothetical protein